MSDHREVNSASATDEILKALSDALGPSGAESGINSILKDMFPGKRHAFDAMGNLAVEIVPKKEGRPVVMLSAHSDEISFIVKDVRGDGSLLLSNAGGIDRRVVYAAPVTVHTASGEYGGVITSGENEVCESDNIVVDIGYSKKDSPVSPGDRVCFAANAFELGEGCIAGKSLDNRAGCAAVIKAAESVCQGIDCGVYLMFSVQEEIGTRGAAAGALNILPDIAIVVDTTFGDTPGIAAEKTGMMGQGVMIGLSPLLHRGLAKEIADLAKRRGIPHQFEIMGASTGTDSDKISCAGQGIKTALLSVPIRNMHTPFETVQISDINGTAKIIAAYVNELGGASYA